MQRIYCKKQNQTKTACKDENATCLPIKRFYVVRSCCDNIGGTNTKKKKKYIFSRDLIHGSLLPHYVNACSRRGFNEICVLMAFYAAQNECLTDVSGHVSSIKVPDIQEDETYRLSRNISKKPFCAE
jgi:hypothetical protein